MPRAKAACRCALALAFLVGAPGRAAMAQKGPAVHHDSGPNMQTIHHLFANNARIRRSVRERPDGVQTLTESDDPKIAAMLREHAHAMEARLKKHEPIRVWDPLFAEVFKHADSIHLTITDTKRGVRILETSRDPETVKIIHAHAQAVSGFVHDGMAGMAKRHEAPGQAVGTAAAKPQFLGKGDGITTCPVTGQPVDRNIRARLMGRTVCFCCPSCVEVVKKQPALYLKP